MSRSNGTHLLMVERDYYRVIMCDTSNGKIQQLELLANILKNGKKVAKILNVVLITMVYQLHFNEMFSDF